MEDDVINNLENMKLTIDEEEVISISDEGWEAEIESCSLSLIGKLLTCRSFNKRAAQGTLKHAWGLENQDFMGGLKLMKSGSHGHCYLI